MKEKEAEYAAHGEQSFSFAASYTQTISQHRLFFFFSLAFDFITIVWYNLIFQKVKENIKTQQTIIII